MWFLGIVLNGLAFLSFEPFGSEEACRLAAKQVQMEKFECVEVPDPEAPAE